MDKEYIKRHNLMEAHKQFMRLSEGYISTSLEEADDDEEQQGGNMPQDNMGGNEDGQMNNGGMQPSGGMPQSDGQGQPNNMPADDGQTPPMDDAQTPPMDDRQAPPMDDGFGDGDESTPNDMLSMDDEFGDDEDDVIDVDDLTNAQEKLNKKQNMVGKDLGQLDNRIESLITAVEKMNNIIDHNNNEINNLKSELERRVPTQKERLEMRSLDTYPFNVSPNDYWKRKEMEGVYDARYGDGESEKKEYEIRNKDIDDFSKVDIEKTFDDNDLDQSMEKIFRGF